VPFASYAFNAATTSTAGNTNAIWLGWNQGTSSAITTATSVTDPWSLWTNSLYTNSTAVTTITTATATAWNNWYGQLQVRQLAGQPVTRENWPPPMTEEQRALRATQDAERARQAALDQERWARENAERLAKQKASDERALRLLTRLLNEAQKRELERDGCFVVTAPSGNRYRIDKGRSGNVKRIDATGQWIESFCIHQQEAVPVYDTMLMQKLLIETHEAEFRRVANITQKNGGMLYGQGRLDAQVLDLAEERMRRAA
jgi:hypothetical protein